MKEEAALFLTILFLSLSNHYNVIAIQDPVDDDLTRVLNSIRNGLRFMDNASENINLDAVIGIRMVEGQLSVLLRHLEEENGPVVPADTLETLRNLESTAKSISDKAVPLVKQSQPQYYDRIGGVTAEGFWTQDYATRDIDPSLIINPLVKGEAMHEDDSDDCLTELLGTSGNEKCLVSRNCWKLMTKQGYRMYSLTHQVFYFLIGESAGCFQGDFINFSDQLNEGYCANILVEATSIADQDFPQDQQDLFMEQQALCGVLGFRQFFRKDWFDVILSWQWNLQGCWGEKSQIHLPTENFHPARSKREERVMPDGCEAHRTAVALGALVQYVRYIIENMQIVGHPNF